MNSSKRLDRPYLIILLILLLSSFFSCPAFAAEKDAVDQLLTLVPDDAIYCVRINNLDQTLGNFDAFLKEIVPVPMIASAFGRGQLAAFLYNPALSGLDTNGSFAIYGTYPEENHDANFSADDLITSMLVPVYNYEGFVSQSQAITAPDGEGFSKRQITGQPPMLVHRLNTYAMITSEQDYEKFANLIFNYEWQTPSSILPRLQAKEVKYSKSHPIWIYFNIEKALELMGNSVLDEMNKAITGNPELAKDGDLQGSALNTFAAEMAKFSQDIETLSISIKPSTEALTLNLLLKAVRGTSTFRGFDNDTFLMKDISDKLEGRDPEKFKSSGGQLDMIPNAENADFLGTFSLLDNADNADAKSMVTYAVTARSGLLAIDLAIPKEHLMQAIAAAADKQGDSQTAGLPALPSMGNFTLPDFTMDPNALPPAMPMPSPVVNDQQDQVQISDSMREHGAEAEAEIAAPLAPVEPDYSKSVSFQLRSAYQKQRDGQFDEAMLAYRSILLNDKATDSYMARTYCRMAECYREKNNTPQAIAQFNFVLDNFPKERYSVMKAKAALKDIEKAAAENDSKQDNEHYYNYDE